MFVGHSVLAFAVVASAASRLEWPRRRALRAGAVAALFAAVPDVDMAYALVGMVGALGGDALALAGAFWEASTVTHRGVTHSLVLALPAAAAFAGWPDRRLAGPLAAGLVALAFALAGPLSAAVAALFVGAGLAVGGVARRYFDRRTAFVLAAVGLVGHPFGDLFTGEPPALLFPLDATVVGARMAPMADPTLNLLFAFAVELGVLWLGLWVLAAVAGWRFAPHRHHRATLGSGYAAAAFVIPPPTFEVSYPFVFSVLAVGVLGVRPRRWWAHYRSGEGAPSAFEAATAGLAAVTVAATAYTLAYLLF